VIFPISSPTAIVELLVEIAVTFLGCRIVLKTFLSSMSISRIVLAEATIA